MRSIAHPPPRSAHARFSPGFGQSFLLTVEMSGGDPAGALSPNSTRLLTFQRLCEAEGAVPTYLAGPDLARAPELLQALRTSVARGRAEIGMRLDDHACLPMLEGVLDEVEEYFGLAPVIARVDPAALAPGTARGLAGCALALDSSTRPLFDCSASGGPDFRHHPLAPWWVDEERTLLELPQTAIFWGLLRRQGGVLHPLLEKAPLWSSMLARLGLLERISLDPETASVEQAIRAIDIALDDGLPLLVFSCRLFAWTGSAETFALFCDWWQRIFTYLELRQIPNTTPAAIMQAVKR